MHGRRRKKKGEGLLPLSIPSGSVLRALGPATAAVSPTGLSALEVRLDFMAFSPEEKSRRV